jgi:hypothetical protein
MNSAQRYQRDAELFAQGVCPVCLKRVGKTESKYAMPQHFYRQKKVESKHALYSRTSYKQRFRPGRSKQPLHPVQAEQVARVLHSTETENGSAWSHRKRRASSPLSTRFRWRGAQNVVIYIVIKRHFAPPSGYEHTVLKWQLTYVEVSLALVVRTRSTKR